MKKLIILTTLLVVMSLALGGCGLINLGGLFGAGNYQIITKQSSVTVEVGAEVDYAEYFIIIDKTSGEYVPTTDDLLDLSQADTSKQGTFEVTCTIEQVSKTITFVVVAKQNTDNGGTTTPTPADLSSVFGLYNDYSKWNFDVTFDLAVNNSEWQDYAHTYFYSYQGANCYFVYDYAGENYTDYIVYDDNGNIVYYYDNGDGTHKKVLESDSDFEEYYFCDYFELVNLANIEFYKNGDHYSAINPVTAGNEILGEYQDCTYTSLDLYVANGKITKIVGVQDDSQANATFTYTLTFSNWGNVVVNVGGLTLDSTSGGTTTPDQGGTTNGTITTTFSNAQLGFSESDGLQFSASPSPSAWTIERGLQFPQINGDAVLTSQSALVGVTSVTVVVQTNQPNGMNVAINVGNTTLTSGGNSVVLVPQTEYTDLQTLKFVSSAPVDGQIKITLDTTATNKSMYIVKVIVGFGESSGGDTTNPDQGGTTTPNNVMPNQNYDASNHVDYDDILSDAQNKYNQDNGYDPAIGLPSQGNYNVLVVPVEFSNDKFSSQELNDLSSVFNIQTNTGWQSVSSYYSASSYGKLNLTFDIQTKVTLSQTYQSYEGNEYGDNILTQVLSILDGRSGFDFSKYDFNDDDCIDGIYLIYSAPIDYDNGDYWWAYVTTSANESTFDGKYAYYYLFASVDFMYENIATATEDPISGLKLNASTYIHETGHMLGLDDYYDYYSGTGSDQGLGNADMMDYTVGDHNAYSKLLLGWVKPTVVTSTQTVTINKFESSGQFVMLLLDYDGTYFSEYLIIDLYSATGLNQMHANVTDSLLYGGAQFGARIYHVSSAIDNPYSDEYGSLTTNNNSISTLPLIKLVEADGDNNYESDQYGGYSYASEDDLWQTGDTLGGVFANYKRNDGKVVNFDISFDSVTSTSLTVTITFLQ